MRITLPLILIITMVALGSALPRGCRGRNCRNFRPGRPVRASKPAGTRPNTRPRLPVAPPPPPPATSAAKQPIVSKEPVSEKTPEKEMITDPDGQEVREAGVNGWLSAPTPAPLAPVEARTEIDSKHDKPGSCDAPKGFGIKCMMRLDQCREDVHCPGATKCCMVGDCGYLCVKPKPTSAEPKEVTKDIPNKKNKGAKGKEGDLSVSSSEIVESRELPEGALKAEDIIELPEDMKQKETEEDSSAEGEEQKEAEPKVSKKKAEEEEATKEVEKKERSLEEEVVEVVEELVEEALEEEIEEAIEELEAATETPVAEE